MTFQKPKAIEPGQTSYINYKKDGFVDVGDSIITLDYKIGSLNVLAVNLFIPAHGSNKYSGTGLISEAKEHFVLHEGENFRDTVSGSSSWYITAEFTIAGTGWLIVEINSC